MNDWKNCINEHLVRDVDEPSPFQINVNVITAVINGKDEIWLKIFGKFYFIAEGIEEKIKAKAARINSMLQDPVMQKNFHGIDDIVSFSKKI